MKVFICNIQANYFDFFPRKLKKQFIGIIDAIFSDIVKTKNAIE